MYMLKAQKKLQSIERHEEEERRAENLERHVGGLKIVRGAVSDDMPQDGPAGAKKKVKYVGSFKVYPPDGLTGKELQRAISGFVWDRINAINPKKVSNPISGTMIINRHGVKILKDKEPFMAYPLKKITYCTAVPKNALFAMVTRSILDQPQDVVYCHSFGLPSAEHANEVSQLMSEAFKIAFAHRTLRRSIEMEAKGKKDKKTKETKSPWDALRRKDKKKSPAPSPGVTRAEPTAPPLPPRTSQSNELQVATPAVSGRSQSPVLRHRTGSVSSSGVTAVGLEAEIMSLEQRIADLEMQLGSLPPDGDAALERTIKLSALEDSLQVKRKQLDTFLLMEASSESSQEPRPPSYNELETNSTAPVPPPQQSAAHLLPPSYSELGVSASRISVAFEDQELVLQDAVWYQAGLPRELVLDILTQQPPGSFIVRDSSSNPGCHAISVVAPDGQIIHYLIVRDRQGYYIQGSDRHHPDLLSLILYHATYQDFLPITLFLGATNPLAPLPPPPGGVAAGASDSWMYVDSDEDDIDDDEMQSHLSNLQFINP